MLSRLGYYFSCSGNVSFRLKDNLLTLTVSSVHSWMPRELVTDFGGSLTSASGKGGARPNYIWRLSGRKAYELARCLAPFSRRKTKILGMLGSTDEKSTNCMIYLQQQLKVLKAVYKRNFFETPRVTSWADFAHLVDCRGSIAFSPTYSMIRIHLNHSNRDLLLSISSFLKDVGAPGKSYPKVHASFCFSSLHKFFSWDMQGNYRCVFIVRKLLENGLCLQKEKAEQVLKIHEFLGSESVPLPSSRYLHGRMKTLSARELELSRLILALRQEQRKTGVYQERRRDLARSMHILCQERELRRKKTEKQRVRENIRKFLPS